MKKTRLFQSVMMLLACVALLVVGIYAVSPAQNNVTGTITVIASNVEVEITAYSSTNKSAATKISDTITARTSTPVPIYDNKLEFDGSNVANSDAVADMTMILEIKNKSASKALGAFFLKDATLPATLTRTNITTSMDFDGKTSDNAHTATDLVTVALQDYTEIGAGQTVDLVCTFSLNSLTDYDMNVDFTLPLVIHEYNPSLTPSGLTYEVIISSSVTDTTSCNVSVSKTGNFKVGETLTLTVTWDRTCFINPVDPYVVITWQRLVNNVWQTANVRTYNAVSGSDTYTFTVSDASISEYKLYCQFYDNHSGGGGA